MVLLEIWCLAYTCARDLKLGTQLEGVDSNIVWIFFGGWVWLEFSTLIWTPTLTIYALGLVLAYK